MQPSLAAEWRRNLTPATDQQSACLLRTQQSPRTTWTRPAGSGLTSRRGFCRLVLGNVALVLQAIGIYAILACTVRRRPLPRPK